MHKYSTKFVHLCQQSAAHHHYAVHRQHRQHENWQMVQRVGMWQLVNWLCHVWCPSGRWHWHGECVVGEHENVTVWCRRRHDTVKLWYRRWRCHWETERQCLERRSMMSDSLTIGCCAPMSQPSLDVASDVKTRQDEVDCCLLIHSE